MISDLTEHGLDGRFCPKDKFAVQHAKRSSGQAQRSP